MAHLCVSGEQVEMIRAHAAAEVPKEACGLLLGEASGGISRVWRVIPAENIATQPETHYYIDDRLIAQYHREIIGFYHSHPRGRAIPSDTDIQTAWVGGAVYLIIGLKDNSMLAWQFDVGQVNAVELHIDACPAVDDRPPLSHFQRQVMLVSALIALVLILSVALYLLPPAPSIP